LTTQKCAKNPYVINISTPFIGNFLSVLKAKQPCNAYGKATPFTSINKRNFQLSY